MRKLKEYALYKGDNFIEIGTAKKLAEIVGISEKSIRFMSTPTYRKRLKKKNSINAMIVVRV